jgi:hypothetical protein
MFIAMNSVVVNIFFITVIEQSRCDYQDRSQYTYLKNMMMSRVWGAKSPSSLPSRKNHGVSFELLRRNLLWLMVDGKDISFSVIDK